MQFLGLEEIENHENNFFSEDEDEVNNYTFKKKDFNNELLKSPIYDFNFPLEETQYASLFPFLNNEFIHEYNFLQQKRNLSDNEELPEKSRKHDIYSKDNIERKIKNVILKCFKVFLNKKINIEFNDEQLLNIKPELLKSEEFKKFLNKSIKDIFSVDINNKYKHYESNHNKLLILKLLNQKDEEKNSVFEKLFNFTFLDVLKHFTGSKKIQELNGMITLEEEIGNFKNKYDMKYKNYFKNYANNFEEIIRRKKKRKPKKPKSKI